MGAVRYSGTVTARAEAGGHEAAGAAAAYYVITGIVFKDDNSGCFDGTFNDDQSVYTVTSSTATFNEASFDLLVLNLNQITFPDGKRMMDSELESIEISPTLPGGFLVNNKSYGGAAWLWSSWKNIASDSGFGLDENKRLHDNPSLLNGDYTLVFRFRHNGYEYFAKRLLRIRY